MIYGRFGGEVKILRAGTLEDVKKLDRRTPDKQDREAIANGSYVVVEHVGETMREHKEQLYHLAYLRADNGFKEIADEMRRLGIMKPDTDADEERREKDRRSAARSLRKMF